MFQEIENAGGAWAALEARLIQTKVAAVRTERQQAVARRKDALTGTSDYPNLDEAPAAVLGVTPGTPPKEAVTTLTTDALPRIRLAEPFEALRDASDRVLAKTGARPKVFLANLGKLPDFTARATFAKNFYEAGGIEAVTNDGFKSQADMVAAFKASGAKLACFCSSDKMYESEAAGAAEALAAAPRRAIALVERELESMPNMLTMRELAVADGEDGPLVTLIDDDQTTHYRVVAAHFEDATTFFPMLGRYEVWQLINLTGDTHPIHLHLDPFQLLSRRPIRYEIPEGGIGERDLAATVTLEPDPEDELAHAIDDNELGLKDTVRVNPNELVEIAVRFTTYSGRYMYHCHILEHEDRDMMRPFVTMPPELMPFMA